MKDIIASSSADSVGMDIAIQVFLRENLRRRKRSESLYNPFLPPPVRCNFAAWQNCLKKIPCGAQKCFDEETGRL